MISETTGVDYSFLDGEDFFAPEADEHLLGSIESLISDIVDVSAYLRPNKEQKCNRAFLHVDELMREVDVWTHEDDVVASPIFTVKQHNSDQYLLEGMLARLIIFTPNNETEFLEFEIYKDKIRRFNKIALLPKPEDKGLEFSDALVKMLDRYEEQKDKEEEARPMNIQVGLDFTSKFTSEQIHTLILFLRNEIVENAKVV